MESRSECIRCGTCCKKGGPAIHVRDMPLIKNDTIPITRLFTIRRGEPAYDNVKGRIMTVAWDIIKIKSRNDSATCFFYEEKKSRCIIYGYRPIECSVLKCWDIREIEHVYNQSRITRRDLIGNIKGLWDLVADHQARCDYEPVLTLVNEIKASGKIDSAVEQSVVYILRYDMEIRALAEETGKIDPDMIDFLFGRPMAVTLDALGIKMRRKNEKIIFTATF